MNLEDVRRAWYAQVRAEPERRRWWLRALNIDPHEVIIDADGEILMQSFIVEDGRISFADPTPIGTHAAVTAAQRAVGQTAVVFASRAASTRSGADGEYAGMSRPERIRAKKAKIAAAARRAGRQYNDADDRVVATPDEDYWSDPAEPNHKRLAAGARARSLTDQPVYPPLADVEAKTRDGHRSRITMGGSGRPG